MSDLVAIGLPIAASVGSGAAIVAYKHPKEFERLHFGLRILLISAWFSVISFGMGMSYAVKNSGADQKVVEQITDRLSGIDQATGVTSIILVALGLYLEFLGLLPFLGIVARNEKPGQE